MLTVQFRDLNPAVVTAVAAAFADIDAFDVRQGDIWSGLPADAVVSPSNSYGWMNGGIDAVYVERFGDDIETRLKACIASTPEKKLFVGEAMVIPTGDREVPNLIAAPTMEFPQPVPNTINAFLAFRAVLRAVNHCGFDVILCPGLATLTGCMLPEVSAQQMRRAWDGFIAS